MPLRLSSLLALAAIAALPATAGAADVPAGATWSEATIPSSDGVKLHADILRPKTLAGDAKTPVIVSIGPYFNHSGQTGPPVPSRARPTTRSVRRPARRIASPTSSTART